MEDKAVKSSWNSALIAIIFAILGPLGAAHSYGLPDLGVELTADVDTVAPGGLITYTLCTTNRSVSPGDDVYLRDILPDGLTPVSWIEKWPSSSYDRPVVVQFGPDRCIWYK